MARPADQLRAALPASPPINPPWRGTQSSRTPLAGIPRGWGDAEPPRWSSTSYAASPGHRHLDERALGFRRTQAIARFFQSALPHHQRAWSRGVRCLITGDQRHHAENQTGVHQRAHAAGEIGSWSLEQPLCRKRPHRPHSSAGCRPDLPFRHAGGLRLDHQPRSTYGRRPALRSARSKLTISRAAAPC